MNRRQGWPTGPHRIPQDELVGEGAPEYAAEIPMQAGPMAGFASEHTLAAQFGRMLNEQDWITWGQQFVLSAKPGEGQTVSRQLLRARRRPPTTWTVQLVLDILTGEAPTNSSDQNYTWTVYIGVGQAKAAIVRKFKVSATSPGVYPQFVDQLVVPALEIESNVDWIPDVITLGTTLKTQLSVFAAPRFA